MITSDEIMFSNLGPLVSLLRDKNPKDLESHRLPVLFKHLKKWRAKK